VSRHYYLKTSCFIIDQHHVKLPTKFQWCKQHKEKQISVVVVVVVVVVRGPVVVH